jgi:hypothetical protein
MPSRRKINWAAVHAAVADRNPDDARPWFLVRHLSPPLQCEVRLAWPDGATSSGSRTERGWDIPSWHSDKPRRSTPPVAWKPLRYGGHVGQQMTPLPDPLRYGILIS